MSGAEVTVEEQPAVERTPADVAGGGTALPLRISLAIIAFTYACVDIVSPALPAIQSTLALSATGAGLVFSFLFAGRLVANLPAAWLVDRIGPKWTAAAGALALLTGSVLAAVATSEATLLPARIVQGAGIALLVTAGLLSLLRALPGGGAAMTAFNVAIGAGVSVGLLAGGYLTTELGWRSVFWVSAAVGTALLAASLLARAQLAEELSRRTNQHDREPSVTPSRAAELAAAALNLLVFVNYSIWIFGLPLLAVRQYQLSAGEVGMLLFFVNGIHLVGAIPIGRVIAKAGARWTLAIGFGVGGLGMLLTPLAPNLPWLLAPVALYAIGQVAGNSAAGDLILRLGGGGGRAVGAVRLTSDIGLVAGPAAAGVLADAAGVEAPFVVLGVAALLTMVAASFLGGRRLRPGGVKRG